MKKSKQFLWLSIWFLASSVYASSSLPQITELSEDLENSEISYSLKSSPGKSADFSQTFHFDEASELIDFSKIPKPGEMVMVESKDGKTYRYGILKTRANPPEQTNEPESKSQNKVLNMVTLTAAACSGLVHIGVGLFALALII